MNAGRSADARLVRRSAVLIGVQVAGISAGLVAAVYLMIVGYVWLQSRRLEALEPHHGDVRFAVDPKDFAAALVLLGGFSIVLAGVATWFIARRATAPIEHALDVQRAFVADASHELRTPLTVLSARLQHLERIIDDPDRRTAVLAELRKDASAMRLVVDELIAAAAPDGDTGGGADLDAELAAAADSVRDLASAADAEIALHAVPVHVRMPGAQLRRALTMILDDAVAHVGPNRVIHADVHTGWRRVWVDVTGTVPDLGPERTLARFAHHPATVARGHGTTTGIGLSLANELVARYGGKITVATDGHANVLRVRLRRAIAGDDRPFLIRRSREPRTEPIQ